MQVSLISFRYTDSPPRADLTWDVRPLAASVEASTQREFERGLLGAPGAAGAIHALAEFVRTAPCGRPCKLAIGGDRGREAYTFAEALALRLRQDGHTVLIEHRGTGQPRPQSAGHSLLPKSGITTS